ncbi:MAG: hypothetical protein DI582_07485 [Azospirillum brasilense]|nr:MAG: hypothetical protein DI582_07485 [Azospirillum brasilense]
MQPEDLTKYYMLPKGSIDPGEDTLDAAIRETHEETGIDLRAMLGDNNIGRLKRGLPVENWRSKAYPGVTVLRADPIPLEHVYYTRASIPTRMALFNVEVEGIEHLQTSLKNQRNLDLKRAGQLTEPTVVYSIGDQTADLIKHPPFDTYLEWIRYGSIPPDQLTREGPARDPRHERMYQLLHGGHAGEFTVEPPAPSQWFARLEYEYAPQGQIASRDDWQLFCRNLPPNEYSILRGAFAMIKAYAKGRGIVGSDKALIKMDDKDSPLHYYQEGADIVPSKRFVAHSLKMAVLNDDYRYASSGDCAAIDQALEQRLKQDVRLAGANSDDVAQLRRHMQIEHSQLAGIAGFVPQRSLVRSVTRFQNAMAKEDPMVRAYGMPGEYDVLDPLIKARDAQRRVWSERMQAPSPEGNTGPQR